MNEPRIVKDSMGTLSVPATALWGAQTQRAIDNFPISDLRMPSEFIQALAYIKSASAMANEKLGLLDTRISKAIVKTCASLIQGEHATQFPIDIFQTGSGTSTNMNINEVIAQLASQDCENVIHANDHVNMSQSSNDVIPSAIHISARLALHTRLMPALVHCVSVLKEKAKSAAHITKTGRTHLMDAMPITLEQEMSGWVAQIENGMQRIQQTLPSIQTLAIGATAVGTGINAHPEFGIRVAEILSEHTGIAFKVNDNYF